MCFVLFRKLYVATSTSFFRDVMVFGSNQSFTSLNGWQHYEALNTSARVCVLAAQAVIMASQLVVSSLTGYWSQHRINAPFSCWWFFLSWWIFRIVVAWLPPVCLVRFAQTQCTGHLERTWTSSSTSQRTVTTERLTGTLIRPLFSSSVQTLYLIASNI